MVSSISRILNETLKAFNAIENGSYFELTHDFVWG